MITGPLVSTAALLEQLDEPALRFVDCRFSLADPEAGRRAHAATHIPGAVYVSLDDDLCTFPGPGRHPLPTTREFADRLGTMGIDNDSTVVVYDDSGGGIASRMWWMLRSLGHERVAVLDGGWQGWLAAGGPTSTDATAVAPTKFIAPSEWSGTIDATELDQRLGGVTLVDARAAERYRGDVEPLDPVAGHIPTAINLPYGDNLDANGRFLSPEDLAKRFAGLTGEIVAYCGSGVTACHDILAMEAAGLTNVILYPGSWSDWSTAGGEVATGAEPGEPTR